MRVGGIVRAPGDKSVSHRALMLAALAPGKSELGGLLTSHDVRGTAAILRRLGAEVSRLSPTRVRVTGRAWGQPTETLRCGNSGTTARLMLGLLAGHAFPARLDGDASLRRRPMRRVTDPLVLMGATVVEEGPDGRLPLTIRGGALHTIDYATPVASAQIKSAILFAGLTGKVEVVVREPARSRDHTERLLRYLGVDLQTRGTVVRLGAAGPLPSFRLAVPGDASSAAFLVAAALLAEAGELTISRVGVNPTRTGFLEVLARMGAAIECRPLDDTGPEPVADLVVKPSPLRATEVAAEEIPSLIDEVPILAVLASRASGETAFRSVGELRVKESNRLDLLARDLRAVGTAAEVQGEDLIVRGGTAPPTGRVETAGDHRLAMAFAVLGTVAAADVRLSEERSVAVSFPRFFETLARAREGA